MLVFISFFWRKRRNIIFIFVLIYYLFIHTYLFTCLMKKLLKILTSCNIARIVSCMDSRSKHWFGQRNDSPTQHFSENWHAYSRTTSEALSLKSYTKIIIFRIVVVMHEISPDQYRCNACIAARGQYFEQYLH